MIKFENTEVVGWGVCDQRYAQSYELLGEE